MILRLSQKLAKKLKAGPLDALSLDENPYADWTAHLFTVNRTQYIILSNTKTLYSCVMFGAGNPNEDSFIKRALNSIREFMQDDGQQFAYAKFIAPASDSIRFAKALDRKTTGSINELILAADHVLADGDASPHEVGFKINDVLLSALASEGFGGYGQPREAFKKLATQQDG